MAGDSASFLFDDRVVVHCVDRPYHFIPAASDGHLGRFCLLALLNCAAMSFSVQVLGYVFIPLENLPNSRIPGPLYLCV